MAPSAMPQSLKAIAAARRLRLGVRSHRREPAHVHRTVAPLSGSLTSDERFPHSPLVPDVKRPESSPWPVRQSHVFLLVRNDPLQVVFGARDPSVGCLQVAET
jgi:hypothetical protein